MSEPYVREYDERCEYIADTIDEHQVFLIPSVGYGDLSSVSVKGWEADVDFSMDVQVYQSWTMKVGSRLRAVFEAFGINSTGDSYFVSTAISSGTVATLTVPKTDLVGTRHIFKVDPVALKMSIDNVEKDITEGNHFPRWLFWWGKNSSTLGSNFADTNTKVYSFKLFAADGTVLYDFIPVRIGNGGGFFDKVNRQMLYSLDYT